MLCVGNFGCLHVLVRVFGSVGCHALFCSSLGTGSFDGFPESSVPSLLSLFFLLDFLTIVVVVKASGPPHIAKLWLRVWLRVLVRVWLWVWVRVCGGMLPVGYFCSNKASFLCQSNCMETMRLTKLVNLFTLSLWDYARFETVVSACLGSIGELFIHTGTKPCGSSHRWFKYKSGDIHQKPECGLIHLVAVW